MNNIITDVSCVDLFCGAGGLTHGFVQEGLRVNAGVDIDFTFRHPYSTNNNAVFIQRDISDMDSSEIADFFTPNTVRVLAGCAPCQPFSSLNYCSDEASDSRCGLLYEFKRIIEEIMPDIVAMENVPGLKHHLVFHKFVEALNSLDYKIWYDVVNCAAYGVPQSRKRLILLASRYGPISMIEPFLEPKGYKTVRQAIGWLRPIGAGESDPRDKLHVASKLSEKNLERIRASKPGGTWRDWPRHLVAKCHRLDTGRTYSSVYGRMEWDKPAPTITTECCRYGSGRFGHPEQDRAISLREAALLQGFPFHYEFVPYGERVRITTVSRLIGNAVPIDLGRAIAKSIIRHINETGTGT